jgi:DNA-binding MarR family transcriptional regulator
MTGNCDTCGYAVMFNGKWGPLTVDKPPCDPCSHIPREGTKEPKKVSTNPEQKSWRNDIMSEKPYGIHNKTMRQRLPLRDWAVAETLLDVREHHVAKSTIDGNGWFQESVKSIASKISSNRKNVKRAAQSLMERGLIDYRKSPHNTRVPWSWRLNHDAFKDISVK